MGAWPPSFRDCSAATSRDELRAREEARQAPGAYVWPYAKGIVRMTSSTLCSQFWSWPAKGYTRQCVGEQRATLGSVLYTAAVRAGVPRSHWLTQRSELHWVGYISTLSATDQVTGQADGTQQILRCSAGLLGGTLESRKGLDGLGLTEHGCCVDGWYARVGSWAAVRLQPPSVALLCSHSRATSDRRLLTWW